MSVITKVQQKLDEFNMGLKVIEFAASTHTSELAATALGIEVGQIAKSLLFMVDAQPVLVVTSGDQKVDAKKLKQLCGAKKVRFANEEQVAGYTGYTVGGVCPVGLLENVRILLDASLLRFPLVYTAAGTANFVLPVTMEQLKFITGGELAELA